MPVATKSQMCCMHQYLRKGLGVPSTVTLGDATCDEVTCSLDGKRIKRPFGVALAHELIHAYYAATGTRIFGEASADDEGMTTGLPPFHFQKYSENLFRAHWEKGIDKVKVGLRLYHKFNFSSFGDSPVVFCFNCGAKNTHEDSRKVNGKWETKSRLQCEKCKQPIPHPDLAKNLPDIDL